MLWKARAAQPKNIQMPDNVSALGAALRCCHNAGTPWRRSDAAEFSAGDQGNSYRTPTELLRNSCGYPTEYIPTFWPAPRYPHARPRLPGLDGSHEQTTYGPGLDGGGERDRAGGRERLWNAPLFPETFACGKTPRAGSNSERFPVRSSGDKAACSSFLAPP